MLGGKFPWGLVIQNQPPINLLGSSEACGDTGELIMDVDRGPGSVKYYCSFPSITMLDGQVRGADYFQYVRSDEFILLFSASLPVKPADLALDIGN